MAAKRALMVYRLNKAAFDYVIGEIHAKFMTSKVRREATETTNPSSITVVAVPAFGGRQPRVQHYSSKTPPFRPNEEHPSPATIAHFTTANNKITLCLHLN